MQRIITGLAIIALGLTVAASTAHAQNFNSPFKGKQFKGNLMTTYSACTAPDTMTDDNVQACSTIVRVDDNCGFGGGQGKIQLKTQTVGNYDARLKLVTLDQGCEGRNLDFMGTVRRTGHYCGGNICTVVDSTFQIGTCKVLRGVCKFGGQFVWPGGTAQGNTEFVDIFVKDNASGLRVFDIGLVKSSQ
jgi:hypothetical protein